MSLDYYRLGRVYPRTLLRKPFYRKRRRTVYVETVLPDFDKDVADTSTSTETLIFLRNILVTDTSSSADTASVEVLVTEYENVLYSEWTIEEVALSVSDTGEGTETPEIPGGGAGIVDRDFTLSETGSSNEALTGTVDLSVSDTGNSSTPPPSIGVASTIADSVASTESAPEATVPTNVSDTGSSSDLISVLLRAAAISDAGSSSDAMSSIAVDLPTLQDSASAQEDPFGEDTNISCVFTKIDSGSASDVLQQINVTLVVPDTGSTSEPSNFVYDMFVYETSSGLDSIVEVAQEDVREILALFHLTSSRKTVIHTTTERSAIIEPTKEVKSIF